MARCFHRAIIVALTGLIHSGQPLKSTSRWVVPLCWSVLFTSVLLFLSVKYSLTL